MKLLKFICENLIITKLIICASQITTSDFTIFQSVYLINCTSKIQNVVHMIAMIYKYSCKETQLKTLILNCLSKLLSNVTGAKFRRQTTNKEYNNIHRNPTYNQILL